MPQTIVMLTTGAPEVLQWVDMPVPPPAPAEAQIRQRVIGVNFVDLYWRAGLYPLPGLPAILGVEGAGQVAALGSAVTDLKVGDRVAYAGMPLGGYAELRNLPASRLVRLPDAIPDEVAGSSMLRGLAAHMLLRHVRAVSRGDWLLVHAAAGGLGQLITRWATRLGARVIGTVGSEAKRHLALQAGAEEVLLHGEPGWVQKARQIAGGEGVHLAIDGVGGARLAETFGAVRPFGVVASVGQAAGTIAPVNVEALGPVRSIALARPSVLAYSLDPVLYAQGTTELLDLLEAGCITPIGASYPLREAAAAHADLGAGRTTGSVVLTV